MNSYCAIDYKKKDKIWLHFFGVKNKFLKNGKQHWTTIPHEKDLENSQMSKLWIKSTWTRPPWFIVPCVKKPIIEEKNSHFFMFIQTNFLCFEVGCYDHQQEKTSNYIPSISVPWTTQKTCFGLQHIFL
jgi:hypothetical protein